MCINLNGDLVSKLEWPEFIECMEGEDVVLVSEAWTNNDQNLKVSGYAEPICKHRVKKINAKRESGGLVCYFKNNIIDGISEVDFDFEDGLSLKMCKEFFGWENDLYLIFTYMRPCDSSRDDIDIDIDKFELLERQIARLSVLGDVMCMGDYNARVAQRSECLILPDTDSTVRDVRGFGGMEEDFENAVRDYDLNVNNMSLSRKNKDTQVNSYGLKLLGVCQASDMIILNGRTGYDKGVGQYTFHNHLGKSTNDLVLSDRTSLYKVRNFRVGQPNIFSDHCVVHFELTVNLSHDQYSEVSNQVHVKWNEEKKGDFMSRIGASDIQNRIESLKDVLTDNNNDQILENAIKTMTDIIVEAGAGHIRVSKEGKLDGVSKSQGRKKTGKWYDIECRNQKDLFCERQKQYLETKDDTDRTLMCTERNIYRKLCRKKKSEFNRDEALRLVKLSKTDSKSFWNEIKKDNKIKNTGSGCDFFNHFSALAVRESKVSEEGQGEIIAGKKGDNDVYIEDLDGPISLEELESTIKGLRRDKSAGQDMILNEFIVNASMGIKLLILAIFNNILKLEYFPSIWAVGNIVPIFKKGDKNDTNNYRGITILSCLGKLFTRLMNNRLNRWAENENKIANSQYGFRKNRGTTDCLFILNGLIDLVFAQGKKLYTVFVDYEKAYDYLDRSAVFYKMYKNGVSSKCINIFKNMYSKIKLNVRGGNNQDYFVSNCGLLQGESTSPLLFSLFISDFEESFSNQDIGINVLDTLIKVLMFADDTAIFSLTSKGLQAGLENLSRYCNKWGITVSTKKTKVVVFRKGGRLKKNEKWNYEGKNIEVLSSFKYLGCTISVKNSFSKCIDELASSGRRALFCLKKCVSQNNEMLPSMQIQLFHTMVLPILSYGCEVWGLDDASPLDVIHLTFLKSLLKVKTSTPNCFVYGELGVFPLIIERQIRMIKFWLKIISTGMIGENFTGIVYKELFALSFQKPNVVTWCTKIRDLLNKTGFGYVWFDQYVEDQREFVSEFRQRVTDMYLQKWSANVSLTSKNRLFPKIKSRFCFEPYLDMNNSCFRVAVSRLRLSSHMFLIERGRWGKKRLNVELRKCTLCDVLEDEFHVLIECPRFTNQRINCLPENLRIKPSMFAFITYFNSLDIEVQKQLALLCFRVQKEYKQYV